MFLVSIFKYNFFPENICLIIQIYIKIGIKSTAELPDYYYGLPNVNSPENDALKRFIMKLNDEKPYPPIVQIIR